MQDSYAIYTEGLTKYYHKSAWGTPAEPALASLDLAVPRGTVFGFLGPNGAGKTTTIRCLMDLIRPSSGKAWVLGRPCGEIQVRKRIGYLPDSPAFGSHLTADQFLNICARLLKIPKSARAGRIKKVLDIVRMTEHRTSLLNGFSRGMLQRIGIAQALLNQPELLILDEPLVGLDPEGRRELLDIIRERKTHGVCIFFCSHILSDVESLCDCVGILNHGRLMTSGPLSELLSVSGGVLRIPSTEEELVRELMMMADGSRREPDGTWLLEFANEERAAAVRSRDFPPTVSWEGRRERLDDLFFRMTSAAPSQEAAENDMQAS